MTKTNKHGLEFVSTYTVRDRPTRGVVCNAPSKTRQAFADEADINKLIKRYGILPASAHREGIFGDVSEVRDLFAAHLQIKDAERTWRKLPKEIRDRFGGVMEILQFIQNPDNDAEAVALGLIEPKASAGTEAPSQAPAPSAPPATPTEKKPAV